MRTMQRLGALLSALVLVTFVVGCAGTESRRSTGTYIDDKTISTKIKADLAQDPVAKATQVQVETYQGVVQLSGFVDTEAAKQRAAEIARNTEGVSSVKNSLVVRGEAQPKTQ